MAGSTRQLNRAIKGLPEWLELKRAACAEHGSGDTPVPVANIGVKATCSAVLAAAQNGHVRPHAFDDQVAD